MNVKARLHRRQSRRQSDYLTAFVAGRRAAVHRHLLPTHAHGAQQQTRRCCGQITGQADGLLELAHQTLTCLHTTLWNPTFSTRNRPRHSLNYSLLPAHKFSRHQIEFCFTYEKLFTVFLLQKRQTCSLFFSRPRSEGWLHHGHTFSIYPCPLSFWLTLPRRVLSTSRCCPPRPCVVFLTCVHLALFLALSLSLK